MIEILPGCEKEILDVWKRELWPERRDPIRVMSSMTYVPGIDMDVYRKYSPSFFTAVLKQKVVGVVSGHRTSNVHFRSRGLWVTPELRRQGIAQLLLRAVERQAQAEETQWLWSYPRLIALSVYLRAGLERNGYAADDPDHCYVHKRLEPHRAS